MLRLVSANRMVAGKWTQGRDGGSTEGPPLLSSHQLAVRKGLEST